MAQTLAYDFLIMYIWLYQENFAYSKERKHQKETKQAKELKIKLLRLIMLPLVFIF